MSAGGFNQLRSHVGHKFECVVYGADSHSPPDNVSLECITCHEVVVDFDAPEDTAGLKKFRVVEHYPQAQVRKVMIVAAPRMELAREKPHEQQVVSEKLDIDEGGEAVTEECKPLVDKDTDLALIEELAVEEGENFDGVSPKDKTRRLEEIRREWANEDGDAE